MTPRPRAIVFDLDGTLIDSLPDIIASFSASLTSIGRDAPDPEVVRALIGLPLADMARAFVADADVPAVVAAYRSIYPSRFTESTRPYPGVMEALATLRGRGFALAVATTKRTDMARDLLAALGMTGVVDHVQGTDDFPHKPAPDVVLRALSALDAEGLWMVGDTVHDVVAGRAAGLATYALTWGTHDAERLRRANPDRLEVDLGALLTLTAG
jgi:phosphoglycolate phosphatase